MSKNQVSFLALHVLASPPAFSVNLQFSLGIITILDVCCYIENQQVQGLNFGIGT